MKSARTSQSYSTVCKYEGAVYKYTTVRTFGVSEDFHFARMHQIDVKCFIMLQKISISNYCYSSKNPEKKYHDFHKNIKQHNYFQ